MTEAEYLKNYRPGDYPRPSVAADMVIFTVLEEQKGNYRKLPEKYLCVLLIERGVHPYLGSWALPGGFVKPGETTEQAAYRELQEETGLDHVYLEQLYTFSDPGRDPRTWVMSCSYMALADSALMTPRAGDDARNAGWFQVSLKLRNEHTGVIDKEGSLKSVKTQEYVLELSHGDICLYAVIEKTITRTGACSPVEYKITENQGLAFDHAKILLYALERLRGKLEYTDLALNLMPEEFTLTQLQQVYEVILGCPLLKAAFRRKAARLVEETDSFTEKEGHRPSRLYRRREPEC